MNMIDAMMAELQHEAAVTRRVFEAIPNDRFAFKPHDKSFSMVDLASHMVNILRWTGPTIDRDHFEFDPAEWPAYKAADKAQLLTDFDNALQQALGVMHGTPNEMMLAEWTMSVNGQTIIKMPRVAVLRGFILSHLIHHRGQLTVYLRLVDAKVPQVYGPSADEPAMAAG